MKPAPIEVSWLGYPATTGVEQIDYRLTDALADPEGNADTCHVEKLFRLEGGFHCYSPRDDVPEVAALPAESNGFITFGSFNNLAKITLQAVEAWSQILQTNQGSHLILKSWMLNYAETRARITSAFALHGIELHHLSLQGWMPAGEYLNLYSQVDIGLDTFPYNGTTTTFESLYLGLPVITLRGERHAGRVGASILTHIGRTEWIADNIRDYVATAQKLANDVPKLAQERANLRQLLQQSSLCDEQGFARKIERAYRKMWREKINRTD